MTFIDEKANLEAGMRRESFGEVFRKPTTLPVEVARHLRELIIRGDIQPGERLNEVKLTRTFGLSRAPIREGLRILQAEGLVDVKARRGAFVRTLSVDGLREIFDTRLMFESYAISQAASTLTEERLRYMAQALAEARAALQEKEYEPWHQASLRFHDAIVELADNEYMRSLYDRVKTSVRHYQIMLIRVDGQPMNSQVDHESILESLIRKDVPDALSKLRIHFGNLEATILENIGCSHHFK
jgi:DNA-binding GntR family transcriptional regulator